MRLIDADALEKYLSDAEIEATRQRKYVFASALNTTCGNVRNFPTIEPERKKGEWILADRDDVPTGLMLRCSECNREEHSNNAVYYSFCPYCGADMRGEKR